MEIEFRARKKEDGKWVEGNYHHQLRKGNCHMIADFDHNVFHEIYRESLEIKDYEGKWRSVGYWLPG